MVDYGVFVLGDLRTLELKEKSTGCHGERQIFVAMWLDSERTNPPMERVLQREMDKIRRGEAA